MIRSSFRKTVALILLLGLPVLPSMRAEERVALVIGNDRYDPKGIWQNLQGVPVNDAQLIAKTLRAANFQVRLETNCSRTKMLNLLNEFKASIPEGGTALFYFAGHGIEFEKENYLMGTNSQFRDRDLLGEEALKAETVIKKLTGAKPRTALIFLDCCREPPSQSWLLGDYRTKGQPHRGLATIDPSELPTELMIGFAASAGTLANTRVDLLSESGPYAGALARHILSGKELSVVMKSVARDVFVASKNAKGSNPDAKGLVVQRPAAYGEILHDFYFVPPREGEEVVPPERRASIKHPFVNSLGMEFVPVPGKPDALMCRTETRVQDFRTFARETKFAPEGGAAVLTLVETDGKHSLEWKLDRAASWEKPGFTQEIKHPVTCVSWQEARAFCAWLSEKEGRRYRLPKDSEWSAAVGSLGKYPWGNAFPPPKKTGNFWDLQAVKNLPGNWNVIGGADYDDGAERTAPVASYPANRFGFFDLSGNVWEWCEDPYKRTMNTAELRKEIPALEKETAADGTQLRVLRGGSWSNVNASYLLSSYRYGSHPENRFAFSGFRVVLELSGG